MQDVVINAQGLGKRYWIGSERRADTLRDTFAAGLTAPFRRAAALARGQGSASEHDGKEFWALRDIDFEVRRGESLGIIGRNGAGKSTLLKILSRITEPSAGHVDLTGRVASLLEVGTGFHPDLTGEENIYLNGAILGMSRREVKQRFGEIVEFAGVQKFLRTAVKHYSSGMYTRLAFAVAAHLESEILIVDEVLAVGDLEFQKRCLDRMSGVARSGRTVLFVSHNLAMIESLCETCLLLDRGRLSASGNPGDMIREYVRCKSLEDGRIPEDFNRLGNGKARATHIRLLNERGQTVNAVGIGETFFVEFTFEVHDNTLTNPDFFVLVGSTMGQRLARLSNVETEQVMPVPRHGGTVRVKATDLNLLQGRYHVSLHIEDASGVVDRLDNVLPLDLDPRDLYGTGRLPRTDNKGFMMFAHSDWQVDYE